MSKVLLMTGALVGVLSVSAVQAVTLDISIAAQGAAYNAMVADAKLRGDGGLQDANLGNVGGGSNRFYANYLEDGVTLTPGRMNNFVQRFDVSSIPAGSIITSAILTTTFANQTVNTRTFASVKLSQLQPGKAWVEGAGQNPATDGSVTWNHQVGNTIPWTAPGATSDIVIADTQTFDLVGVDGSATVVSRDITTWVQNWVNTPANNTGMLWWGGNNGPVSGTEGRYFHLGTKEDGAGPASDANAAAPTLVIQYTVVPEPGAIMLLAAGFLTSLTYRRRVS